MISNQVLLDIWVLGFCIGERLSAHIPFLPCAHAMLLHGVHVCQPRPLMRESVLSLLRGGVWALGPAPRTASVVPRWQWCSWSALLPNVVCKHMRTPFSLNWMPRSGVFTWSAASWVTTRYTGHSHALRPWAMAPFARTQARLSAGPTSGEG